MRRTGMLSDDADLRERDTHRPRIISIGAGRNTRAPNRLEDRYELYRNREKDRARAGVTAVLGAISLTAAPNTAYARDHGGWHGGG
jgi:hypothetical protein